MSKLEKDLEGTYGLLNGDTNSKYSPIYYCSNERLNNLFSNFDVKDKDVLTVLASSDFLFYSYLGGARVVDTFDRNKLTMYYYYLRKWVIKYYDKFYPNRGILFDTHNFISKLLDVVECDDKKEREAYKYWSIYCSSMGNGLFYPSLYREENEVEDISILRDRLDEEELKFTLEDVTKRVNDKKKYDIVITSNLLEYIHEPIKLKRVRDNLSRLVKDNGIVVCSYVVDDSRSSLVKREKDIFSEEFYCIEFPSSGYCYKKKC